jgi:hypothetical protein
VYCRSHPCDAGCQLHCYCPTTDRSRHPEIAERKRVTLSCIDGNRGSGRYTMAKNFGTIQAKYQKPDGSSAADTGRVRAEGNQLCLTFKVLNDGQEHASVPAQRGRASLPSRPRPVWSMPAR